MWAGYGPAHIFFRHVKVLNVCLGIKLATTTFSVNLGGYGVLQCGGPQEHEKWLGPGAKIRRTRLWYVA